MIASIAIGLAVDDTIHYLVRYNREFKTDLDEKRAIRDTLTHVGRADYLYHGYHLCGVFHVLLFSSFKPTAIFGVMMVITSLSALVGDLILLPSLIQHVEVVTLMGFIALSSSARSHLKEYRFLKDCRVHSGSLHHHGRIAYQKLMPARFCFIKGDPSDSMYAVVSGAMDVLDPDSDVESDRGLGGHKLINQLKTGDVLGEMGFLRSVPRSASVIATQPAELLKINWKMIKRLQWLYPPTAHKIFL